MTSDAIVARLQRCIRILLLLQFTEQYNATQLARMFGVSRRTIYRDILALRESGVPIEFDEDLGTYFVRGDFTEIHNLKMEWRDLLAIATAVESSPAKSIPGFKERLDAAWIKFLAALPEQTRNHAAMLKPLTNIACIKNGLTCPLQVEHWNMIFDAIARRESVALTTKNAHPQKTFVFRPESLAMESDGWLICGFATQLSVDVQVRLENILAVSILKS